jgi:tRNA threonylcarbamoyladenosine biosynthesis protein TsaB
MKILALEFSANERSVAFAEKRRDGSTNVLSLIRESDYRGVTGLAIIDGSLAEANVDRAEVTRIAVGLGPGSYTGVRSAIALAQGWQLGRAVELVGVSSVVCLAQQARTLRLFGSISIVIDAQRGELYVAQYQVEETQVIEVEALGTAAPSEVRDSDWIVGPEATKWFGDARDLAPSAETLARIAAEATNFTAGELLEPIYLRQAAFVKAPTARHIE